MANYEGLKAALQQVVKTNGKKEITGQLLQDVLIGLVNHLGAGYQFIGLATPQTNPEETDNRVFYLAGPGTYEHFDNLVVPQGAIGFFIYGANWTATIIDVIALVNDLTTGGIDKALSAEQGKVLQQSIITQGQSFERALNETAQSLSDAITQGDQTLAGQISQTDTNLRQLISETSQTLSGQIAQTDADLRTALRQTEQTLNGNIQGVSDRVGIIEGKIPAAASAQNQLADKDYVNEAVRESAADFKGTYDTLQELEAVTADKNDYGYVVHTDASGNNIYDRYMYTGTEWVFQYSISSPVFSASEWAAIRSGINTELVAKLTALPDNVTLQQALTAITDRFADYTKTVDLATIATSGRLSDAEQDAEHRTVTDEEKADWNDKAEKAGNYPLVAAGSAKVIEGTTPVAGEYTFRPSGGGASRFALAMIDKIKGKSLAWNQVLPDGDFHDAAGVKKNRLDVSVANNVMTGVVNSISYDFVSFYFDIQNAPLLQVGHKFLFAVEMMAKEQCSEISLRGNGTIRVNNPTPNVWYRLAGIGATTASVFEMHYDYEAETIALNNEVYARNAIAIDLTRAFGEGHEPATVAEFERLYWLKYFGYDPGSIINNKAIAIETTGLNQWDEEKESGRIGGTTGQNEIDNSAFRSKNYIPVFPSTQYSVTRGGCDGYLYVCEYAADKTFLRRNGVGSSANVIMVSADAHYIRVMFYEASSGWGVTVPDFKICINISNPARNGQYEPYRKVVLNLNLTTATGKLNGEGESVVICADGLKGVGSVYDELIVENGYATKIIRRTQVINMGELDWHLRSDYATTGDIYAPSPENARLKAGEIGKRFIISDNLEGVASAYRINISNSSYIAVEPGYSTINARITDKTLTDVQIRAMMSGHYCVFALETPEVYILDTPIYVGYQVDEDGTERRLPEDTASVVNAPFACDIIYPLDINDYLSKAQYEASQKDMLDAFVAAGKITAYTMAWNESEQKFDYTIS